MHVLISAGSVRCLMSRSGLSCLSGKASDPLVVKRGALRARAEAVHTAFSGEVERRFRWWVQVWWK